MKEQPKEIKNPELKDVLNMTPGLLLSVFSLCYLLTEIDKNSSELTFLLVILFCGGFIISILAFHGRGLFYRRYRQGSDITFKDGEREGETVTYHKPVFIALWRLIPGIGDVKSVWEHPS